METGDNISSQHYSHSGESGDGIGEIRINPELSVMLNEKEESIELSLRAENMKTEELLDTINYDTGVDIDKSENTHRKGPQEYVKVFIRRDYSVGRFIKFDNTFPDELEGKIDQEIFEKTINGLNSYFAEVENISCYTCIEGCLACLTAHLIYLCKPTPYEKCLKKVSQYVAQQNQLEYEPKGLKLMDPSVRGLRAIEICSVEKLIIE